MPISLQLTTVVVCFLIATILNFWWNTHRRLLYYLPNKDFDYRIAGFIWLEFCIGVVTIFAGLYILFPSHLLWYAIPCSIAFFYFLGVTIGQEFKTRKEIREAIQQKAYMKGH